MANRPEIPQSIKRQVRQRCHFGCVLCGSPVYHYDHIVEYSKVGEHSSENLTLLCPGHHDGKTRGRVSTDAVIRANNNPHNFGRGTTSEERVMFGSDSPTVIIGDNKFTSTGPFYPFIVDCDAPITVYPDEDNSVLFDIVLRDKYNWDALTIHANEVKISTRNWDVTWEGDRLKLREAERSILLVMRLDVSNNSIVIEKARFYWNGVIIIIDEQGLYIPGANVDISSCTFEGTVGFQIGEPTKNQPIPSSMMCFNVDRYEKYSELRPSP